MLTIWFGQWTCGGVSTGRGQVTHRGADSTGQTPTPQVTTAHLQVKKWGTTWKYIIRVYVKGLIEIHIYERVKKIKNHTKHKDWKYDNLSRMDRKRDWVKSEWVLSPSHVNHTASWFADEVVMNLVLNATQIKVHIWTQIKVHIWTQIKVHIRTQISEHK